MKIERGGLLAGFPAAKGRESFEPLFRGGKFRIERIVSSGQATAPGEWYDQPRHEWVLLLAGSAGPRA